MRVCSLVPAYFYPAGNGLKDWNRLMDAAKSISLIAIANPNSGPGAAPDQNYSDVLAQAKGAGIQIIGYVSTNYGKRSAAEIKADVDRWVSYYPEATGIFFDEQSSGDNEIVFYSELFAYARSKFNNALVVGNPGGIPSERYFSEARADIECIFESDKGFNSFTPPSWAGNYSPDRFCVLLLRISNSDFMKKVRKAVKLGMGNIYVTDDKLSNPWDRLPSYWEQEVETLKQLAK